jgi:hypothetical protein
MANCACDIADKIGGNDTEGARNAVALHCTDGGLLTGLAQLDWKRCLHHWMTGCQAQ